MNIYKGEIGLNVSNEIKCIESSLNLFEINLQSGRDVFENVLRLSYFELTQYKKLIVKLNIFRKNCLSYDEKEALIPEYKSIYMSARKMYRRMLTNIEKGKLKIRLDDVQMSDKTIYKDTIEQFLPSIEWIDLSQSLLTLLKYSILSQLEGINDQLYILKKHPHDYINTNSNYIGPIKIMRYRNDNVFYKDVSMIPTDSHSYSVSYNEKTNTSTKNAILDIFAYLNGRPFFYLTDNPEFNRKICELYEQFDLLDMIRLRKKNYFSTLSDKPISLQLPILSTKDNRNLVEIPESYHEQVFELYHASLKQFEPMPRCVFLYRVFEYGAKYHYQKIVRPANYDPKDAIEYYITKIFKHRFTPLYYIDYGSIKVNNDESIEVIRKSKCINFISKLKIEAKSIFKEWQLHNFLSSKRIGEIIYNTGRNASAHASGGAIDARYDYGMNYQHINNVNIILELIARYIIDSLNVEIVKLVDRSHEKYIK